METNNDNENEDVIKGSSKAVSVPKMENLSDVQDYLEQLATQTSSTVEAALNAQLQVIRYVQSPKLYDSTFDLLFQNVKKALRLAESEGSKEEIREKTTVMIQNYVFFIQAKLDFECYKIDERAAANREEARQLLADAAKTLIESSGDVAMMAAAPGAKMTMKAAFKAVAKDYIKKLQVSSSDSKEKKKNLLERIVDWWTEDSRLAEQQERIDRKRNDFYKTLSMLTDKLSKQQPIIGKSDLIAGMISRYAQDMTDNSSQAWQLCSIETDIDILEDDVKEYCKKIFWWIFGVSAGIAVIRAVWKLLAGIFLWISGNEAVHNHWFLTQGIITGTALAAGFLIVGLYFCIRRFSLYLQKKKAAEAYSQIYYHYIDIAQSFEE